MRRKKLSISLTPEENSLLIKSLNHLRNKLLGENKATVCGTGTVQKLAVGTAAGGNLAPCL